MIGYESYKTEFKLREAFADHLEDIANKKDHEKKGYNPIGFPDLMICGESSIIKNVGMPFAYPMNMQNEFYWEILMTSPNRPMYFLLEMIWTRLSYQFGLGSKMFGDDFSYDTVHSFLSCKEQIIKNKHTGWEYSYHGIPSGYLNNVLTSVPWEPMEIETFEQALFFLIIEHGFIEIDDELEKFCAEHDVTLDDLTEKWKKGGIAYIDNNKIHLLIDAPVMITHKNGKQYIGENKSGEMMIWVGKNKGV